MTHSRSWNPSPEKKRHNLVPQKKYIISLLHTLPTHEKRRHVHCFTVGNGAMQKILDATRVDFGPAVPVLYEDAYTLVSLHQDMQTKDRSLEKLVALESACLAALAVEEPEGVKKVDADKLLMNQKQVGLMCNRCKKQDTEYRLLATRSADEGMTAICVCRQCKFQWTLKM